MSLHIKINFFRLKMLKFAVVCHYKLDHNFDIFENKTRSKAIFPTHLSGVSFLYRLKWLKT
jgi:hypothetical protein